MNKEDSTQSIKEPSAKRKMTVERIMFLIASVLPGLFIFLCGSILVDSFSDGTVREDIQILLPIILISAAVFALMLWLALKKDTPPLAERLAKQQVVLEAGLEASKKNINFVVNKLYRNLALIFNAFRAILLTGIVVSIFGIIFISSIFGLFLAISFFCTITILVYWPWQAKANIRYLLQTKQTDILNEVFAGRFEYNPVAKIAFADTFFFCRKSKAIISYKDIYWVYKKTKKTTSISHGTSIEINMMMHLKTGNTFKVNAKKRMPINGAAFEEVLTKTIREHRPTAMFGYSITAEAQYATLCDAVKTPEQRAKEEKRMPYVKIVLTMPIIVLAGLAVWSVYYSFSTGDVEGIIWSSLLAIMVVFLACWFIRILIDSRKSKKNREK